MWTHQEIRSTCWELQHNHFCGEKNGPRETMKGGGAYSFTAACHQRVVKLFWWHFWGALMNISYIQASMLICIIRRKCLLLADQPELVFRIPWSRLSVSLLIVPESQFVNTLLTGFFLNRHLRMEYLTEVWWSPAVRKSGQLSVAPPPRERRVSPLTSNLTPRVLSARPLVVYAVLLCHTDMSHICSRHRWAGRTRPSVRRADTHATLLGDWQRAKAHCHFS